MNILKNKEKKLTKPSFWENYWDEKLNNDKRKKESLLILEILKIFDTYLPVDPSLSILEIGGAPGEYLVYMSKKFGYSVNSMDYSSIGNKKTRETFEINRIPITIFEKDLFSSNEGLPLFDIVYSLGFIEHFDNPKSIIAKHLEVLKPGGIILIGVPNLSGIYHVFLKHLSPSHDKTHNLRIMDIRCWDQFEKDFNLTRIFQSYVGGFEPMIMKKLDKKSFFNNILYFFIKILMVLFSFRMRFLRRFNSKYWSGYLIGIYTKPL
jgi:2-polyprenyl-3-methyl-5-hydroxy-6-metoxy-1,4-benzoquinol methylase